MHAAGVRKLAMQVRHLGAFADRMGPLMEEICLVMVEDNRRGVLRGVDGNDAPMIPTKYRGSSVSFARARRKNRFGTTEGTYKGPKTRIGKVRLAATADNGNLTTAEYRKLNGPPLAPRRDESRVIANLATRYYRQGDEWVCEKRWINVVSRKGKPFLSAHFLGRGGLPKRDLRGVRAWGVAEARKRCRTWLIQELSAA